ncbi:nucleotide sugar dehydrogenase [Campylobacter sp. 2018MI35]|uniref:nucleotide sugar dehydrogenase n=1 Tax=Campylobacter molothri TaxID=1032242 RepID=UPI0019060F2F|nr:nucleotide sugar dehydrogenase [Campylobacter sp. 2018MI35]MBZ7930557.1 nucleotide sugar dehydrogenase [Campylobacter sp. W0067]MBZ7934934.1 nucleotide sugar dehydrogenase [Campylobacter sp. W0065]MBZ7944332.1 nucleotide sugar dehydrogenase [Campylobacter sp. RM13744]MBZ7947209.1 nucleotide sugar dehydrogenase [Campylobacter sp. RM10536]MBZ7953139.1 nucleotide sugar dehydrogenase [Campylobacter sp. RM9939]MBZ7957519.1 nucleotide sugar dehydrogenase [Campylobacter sp. RM10541]MBZ7963345.1 
MNILVVGIGYVGLANAIVFSKSYNVLLADISKEKIKSINDNLSPIQDDLINSFFKKNPNKLKAIDINSLKSCEEFDYVIIAVSTNYKEEINFFDTSNIEKVLENLISKKLRATVIIKSTIPIGYTEKLKKQFQYKNIIFSPEFLREGYALYDSLNPSRIIIGDKSSLGKEIGELFYKNIDSKDVKVFYMDSKEAESVKLFSNTYLAMRVSFFNEVDSYARVYNLNVADIIKGVCADPRIGNYYNNPSFGYGGYCLPKDTKQLLASFKEVPNCLISSIVESNIIRKQFIAKLIVKNNVKIIGIYRLIMKHKSDNFRSSVIFDIMQFIKEYDKNINFIIYEPLINERKFENIRIENNLNRFLSSVDLVVANRLEENLLGVKNKVFSSDLFLTDC